jgi:peptidylprolyl isomerase
MLSIKKILILGVLIAAGILAAGCTQQAPAVSCDEETGVCMVPSVPVQPAATSPTPVPTIVPLEAWERAVLETDMGTITIALDPAMPVTAGNFKSLVANGYYDGVIFHRVASGFMIQGGDPTGTGRGGPGYTIPDEFARSNRNDRGTVAMANAGPNTGGSQFFINLVNNNYLDKKHPVFGRVVEGMEVVDAIAKVETTGEGGNYRPLQNVTIIRAEMI